MFFGQCLRRERIEVVQAEQPGALRLVILRLVLHHAAVGLDRQVNAIGLLVDQSAAQARLVQLGIDGQRPFQSGQCLVQLFGLGARESEVAPGGGKIRVETDGVAKVGKCGVKPFRVGHECTESVMCFGGIRLEGDDLSPRLKRFRQSRLRSKGEPQRMKGLRGALTRNRGAQRPLRLRGPAGGQEREAETQRARGGFGINRDGLVEQADRVGMPALLIRHRTGQMERIEVPGGQFSHLLIERGRPIQSTRSMVGERLLQRGLELGGCHAAAVAAGAADAVGDSR
jgi:hypothetical protein